MALGWPREAERVASLLEPSHRVGLRSRAAAIRRAKLAATRPSGQRLAYLDAQPQRGAATVRHRGSRCQPLAGGRVRSVSHWEERKDLKFFMTHETFYIRI